MGKLLSQTGGFAGRFLICALLLALGLACAGLPSYAGAGNRLFSPAAPSRGKIDEAMRPRIFRHRFVDVNFRLLDPNGERPANGDSAARLILNLFDDAVFPAVLDRREVRSPKSFIWHGHVAGVENSQVTLAVENGVIAGNVRADSATFQIRYGGEGTHVIYQINPNAFPRDIHPSFPPPQ
jgi:hypothetical protein